MSNSVTNFYTKKEVKKFVKNYSNPSYNSCLIKHPFRAIIIGSSGSGKSLVAIEIIKRLSNTFDFVVLVTRDASEPLYQYLQSKLQDLLYIYEIDGKTPIPSIQDISKLGNAKSQILVVYDDLVNEKNQSNITEAYIRARKLNRGISLAYLSQSFYRIPKTIRLQANIVIIKKVSSMRDIRLVVSEYDVGKTRKEIEQAYEEATKDITSFLMIRLDEKADSPYKFTKGFTETI